MQSTPCCAIPRPLQKTLLPAHPIAQVPCIAGGFHHDPWVQRPFCPQLSRTGSCCRALGLWRALFRAGFMQGVGSLSSWACYLERRGKASPTPRPGRVEGEIRSLGAGAGSAAPYNSPWGTTHLAPTPVGLQGSAATSNRLQD